MQKKEIIFFTDLEGTILSEHGGFDDEGFYNFISELSNLANTVKADVNLAIVSPMSPAIMTRIMSEIDTRIRNYDRLNNHVKPGEKKYSVDLKTATADFYDSAEMDYSKRIDRRIDELKMGTRRYGENLGLEAKANYVNGFIDSKESNTDNNVVMYIYAGNGKNDFSAMKVINRAKNGITICPLNTFSDTKKQAKIKSNLRGVRGIADCIKQIREKIQPRSENASEKRVQNEGETK